MRDKYELSRMDFEILRLLMDDARLSNKEVATSVGLAPSSCHERTKALRKRGILLGSHAEVNLQALGLTLEALLFVQLAKLKRPVVDKFLREIAVVREVRSVFLVSGRFDLVVHVVIRDMEHLKNLISDRFNRRAVVVRVETSVVFNRAVQYGMPLPDGDVRRAGASPRPLPKNSGPCQS
jgi:DNA-binding Lrp family transcriptional regulator